MRRRVARGWKVMALAILSWVAVLTLIAFVIMLLIPACKTEDSSNCGWDAAKQGNGQGRSFIDIGGVTIYPIF